MPGRSWSSVRAAAHRPKAVEEPPQPILGEVSEGAVEAPSDGGQPGATTLDPHQGRAVSHSERPVAYAGR